MNDLQPLHDRDTFPFQCQQCGKCCQHAEDQVMLETRDAFYLARYLREQGQDISDIDDIYERFAHPIVLTQDFPIFTLNTMGSEQSCIFLKDHACSVYEARPRVCRLYPVTAAPGSHGQDFRYLLCTEKPHHFHSTRVVLKDWLYQNFSKESRAYAKGEFEAAVWLGQEYRRMGSEQFLGMLGSLLFYRYFNYDLDAPFLPQYQRNIEALHKALSAVPDAPGLRESKSELGKNAAQKTASVR